eukprot:CAMPEP_0119103408 /NCGR_PEP_ID=MMETSP1180-20130426/1834_1 /TAXON_ID=3052 ORGANISM="Chlamydomonas cf sp, Strain CCMP681" /NCGR_SAMPLE_ID=MMETSP1180 /ASSEMBLY_ACC=CAM_ASM_000741 /LENGTH=206 /DNA_ID=CAMNT_0007087895 /DNA_START=132 /DNA_END=752 /DNA_ORIENTATION=-
MKNLAVFCGSSSGSQDIYAEAARALGSAMVAADIGLVYGGGTVGLMGAVARSVHDGGGKVYGVIPQALAPKEISGEAIGELKIVSNMHVRKEEMAKHADGFIGLPGGFGTLEELLEVITWQQLGFHSKPIGLLNIGGYYDSLLTFFQNSVDQGFVKAVNNDAILVSKDPVDLIKQMRNFKAPVVNLARAAADSSAALGVDVSHEAK